MKITTDKFTELLSSLNVLYVEDEEAIRYAFETGIGMFFKSFVLAENGQDGVEEFKKYHPDIIITDVNMPVMGGMEMLRQIRMIDEEVPVVMVTAYDDIEYLMESIEIGVDAYLLKPVQMDHFKQIVGKIALGLHHKKQAQKLSQLEIQQKVNHASEYALTRLTEELSFPVVMLQGEDFFFVNNAMAHLVSCTKKKPGDFVTLALLNDLIVKREGCITDFKELQTGNDTTKVALQIEGETRFFSVQRSRFDRVVEEKEMDLVVLYDITNDEKQRLMIDYQKSKLENYNTLLEDLLITKFFRNQISHDCEVLEEEHQKKEEKKPAKDSVSQVDSILSAGDKELLHKSRQHKTDAKSYLAEIDQDIFQEISVLGEIERDLHEGISEFIDGSDVVALNKITNSLEEYGKSLRFLIEFEDLGNAILSLGTFLKGVTKEDIDQKYNKLLLYLENIINDLSEWRANIFVTQHAVDIHYLDSSLFSSCLQLQLDVGANAEIAHDDDDLGMELF